MTPQLIEHVRVLSQEIGSRMIGTAGNRAAAEYIASTFLHAGWQVERLAQPVPAWEEQSTLLEAGGLAFEAHANSFSPPCAAEGKILPVGTLTEAESADLAGKIVLLYGELAQGPLSPKAFFFAPERDLKLIARLESAKPAAVLTVNPVPGMRYRLIEDPDFAVPSATVPLVVGMKLLRLAGTPARLQISSTRQPGSSDHIIARFGPASLPAKPRRVIVCAHYDSKPDTPGAVDNACGVGVLLALAERLARLPLASRVELIAFTNEEFFASPANDAYNLAYGTAFDEITALVNVDGAGGAITATSLATFAGSPAFEEAVEQHRATCPGIIRVDPWPQSNHYLFFSNGVPSVAISSAGPREIYHTPLDSFETVSPEKLEVVTGLVEGLVRLFDGKAPEWGRAAG